MAGYVLSPSVVGQLGSATLAVVVVATGLETLDTGASSIWPWSVGVLALGLLWLVLAERGSWRRAAGRPHLTARRPAGAGRRGQLRAAA